jgi:hypothetical protein
VFAWNQEAGTNDQAERVVPAMRSTLVGRNAVWLWTHSPEGLNIVKSNASRATKIFKPPRVFLEMFG